MLLLRKLIKKYPKALSSFNYKEDYVFFIPKKLEGYTTEDIYTLKHIETGLYLNPINKNLYTKVPYVDTRGKAKGKAIGKAKGKAKGKAIGKNLGKAVGKSLRGGELTSNNSLDLKEMFNSLVGVIDDCNLHVVDSWEVYIPDLQVQQAMYNALGFKLGDNPKTDLVILKCFIVWYILNTHKTGIKDDEVDFTDTSSARVGDITTIISHDLYTKLIKEFLNQGIMEVYKQVFTDYNTTYTTYKILRPLGHNAPKITITLDSHPQIMKTIWLFLKKKNLGRCWSQVIYYKDTIQFDIDFMKRDIDFLRKEFAIKYKSKKRKTTLKQYIENSLSWMKFFELYEKTPSQMKAIYFKHDSFGNRLHSPWTYCPKEYRKYIKSSYGSTEIDLRASQPTLLCQILCDNNVRDEKFIKDVENDRYYTNIMKQYKVSRESAKQIAMKELYCRVLISRGKVNPVIEKFKKRYPVAGHYCQEVKSVKRISSEFDYRRKIKRNANLAMDLQRFESKIFSEIRAELVLKGIEHAPIHDAIIILDNTKIKEAENIIRDRLNYHLKDVKYHLHMKTI